VCDAIAAVAGPGVTLVETGAAMARQVERRLAEAGLLTPSAAAGRDRLVTTGAAAAARILWPEAARVEVLDLALSRGQVP